MKEASPRRARRPATSAIVPADAESSKPRPKTAVVMIHGMGEQWPMDTLRGFVEAAWSSDPDLNPEWSEGETYSKPERITGSFELRRITTRFWARRPGSPDRRVDFFEFYWAHMMQGNSFGAVLAWL